MSNTASMASLWALLYATAILESDNDAYTDNSGSSGHSKSDAEAGWIIISTLTLALAGFMLILTFWLIEHIIYKIAKPVKERVFAKKPKMDLFVTAGIFALIGLIYSIVAIKVHSNNGWPNMKMRMILLVFHMTMFATEAMILVMAFLISGMVAARREIRARRRIKEIDMQLGELESGSDQREGVAR
ncbi:hypothetical protein LTR10_005244 [Elasticomyces elasticus]|nr:hypothetical protein LTR10_005244 [Elasticomyces elasticus]KAK4975983.1 hypothetical protein LTR42_003606 [Elasticomyces elasticus]KAK5711878.1 hypothetical protein LTR15_012222 [Elasticomyces elasticus]